jgi:hypothetical protein
MGINGARLYRCARFEGEQLRCLRFANESALIKQHATYWIEMHFL